MTIQPEGLITFRSPALLPGETAEVIVIFKEISPPSRQGIMSDVERSRSQRGRWEREKRVPHPDIASKVKIMGYIFNSVPSSDWNFSL